MTDESGRAIALVILGIVAVIAIVGLVLLFTGAKTATGEFYAPGAKEYGGELRGVYAPLARWDIGGKTYYQSGQEGLWSAGKFPDSITGEQPGDIEKNVQQDVTFKRDPYDIYSSKYMGKSCNTGYGKSSVQEKNAIESTYGAGICYWFEEGQVFCCPSSALRTK